MKSSNTFSVLYINIYLCIHTHIYMAYVTMFPMIISKTIFSEDLSKYSSVLKKTVGKLTQYLFIL